MSQINKSLFIWVHLPKDVCLHETLLGRPAVHSPVGSDGLLQVLELFVPLHQSAVSVEHPGHLGLVLAVYLFLLLDLESVYFLLHVESACPVGLQLVLAALGALESLLHLLVVFVFDLFALLLHHLSLTGMHGHETLFSLVL